MVDSCGNKSTKCQCDFCKKYGPIFDEYEKFKKDNPNLVMQRYESLEPLQDEEGNFIERQ